MPILRRRHGGRFGPPLPRFGGEGVGGEGERLAEEEGCLRSPRALAPSPPPLSPEAGERGENMAGRRAGTRRTLPFLSSPALCYPSPPGQPERTPGNTHGRVLHL